VRLVLRIFLVGILLLPVSTYAQDMALPTFTRTYNSAGTGYSYTVVGIDPGKGGVTTIPTVLVPITLTIEAPMDAAGKRAVLDASPDVARVIASPIFARYPFASGKTQYTDAIMRADFHQEAAKDWHTLLGKPKVVPLKIDVPIGKGYVLISRKTGRMLAMVDVLFMQQEIFKQLPKEDTGAGKLVIAMTKNVTYYTSEDATECCSWGTHGVDTTQGLRQPFVLGSYLDPHTVEDDSDVQPLTQQLAQWFRDPLHEPALRVRRGMVPPGNIFPSWMRVPPPSPTELPADNSDCGGTALAVDLFLNDPTDMNWKNRTPASRAYIANVGGMPYHLQNAALLSWYTGSVSPPYSFPDAKALSVSAKSCPTHVHDGMFGAVRDAPPAAVPPIALTNSPNGHHLIGYWSGLGRISEVSPQWDVIIVAFATPLRGAAEGTMQYQVRGNITPEQFKDDIKLKQSQGKKVMISLGGGGQHFALMTEEGKQNFIRTVEDICTQFGFNGIDIDFETSSLELDPGDTDFKHPTTPSTVNLIAALREIHDHFGRDFMLSLVPEGTQIPAAYPGYGGQFGSYLPIVEGIRDILAFVDTQDYNCPPIEGLDGEYYMPGSVDYHAAATELVLHGFDVGRDPKHHFDPLPPDKVAIGYLNSDTTPPIVEDTMRYMITGKSATPVNYRLRQPKGYPGFLGAMFWTIDDDRKQNFRYSNTVGPLLHSYPAAK
jgi:chitinase